MKKDFFVSYTKKNEDWAEWIAWQLEEMGYSVIIQAWDFKAGCNFVEEMQKASTIAERTIAILSTEYMKSGFANAEWQAAFASDPSGRLRKLITVRIEDFKPKGLLGQIIYIDLVGLSREEAINRLRTEIPFSVSEDNRLKPKKEPSFPGQLSETLNKEPMFPNRHERLISDVTIPSLKRFTDLDKIRFMERSYEEICSGFRVLFEQVRKENSNFHFEMERASAKKNIFKLFVDQSFKLAIKIWLGSIFGSIEQINFWFGHWIDNYDNSMNEIVSCRVENNDLKLQMTMNMHGNRKAQDVESIIKSIWDYHIVSSLR